MSSTQRKRLGGDYCCDGRYGADDGVEFGMRGDVVARRARRIQDPRLREFLMLAQYWSHQEGGLQGWCNAIAKRFPERLQSRRMREIGIRSDKVYSGEVLEKIAASCVDRRLFGTRAVWSPAMYDRTIEEIFDRKESAIKMTGREILDEFAECVDHLPEYVSIVCLDERFEADLFNPPYFPDFVDSAFEHQEQLGREIMASVADTCVKREVIEWAEMADGARKIVLLEGRERTGKSHAAQALCRTRPGRFRFVDVPCSQDDFSFYSALARDLGTQGAPGQRTGELRESVQSMLADSRITIVLDESQYLLPTSGSRSLPRRLNWLMTALANRKIPAVMISTPQLTAGVRSIEKNTGWRSGQFQGRVLYKELPSELSLKELTEVARVHLPGGDKETWKTLAQAARISPAGTAAIRDILDIAELSVRRNKNQRITLDAILEVIEVNTFPSDSGLSQAIAEARPKRPRSVRTWPIEDGPPSSRQTSPPHSRSTRNVSPITSEELHPTT